MYTSEKYIENLLLESKWMKMLKAGKLSKAAIQKIKKLHQGGDPLYVKQLLKQGKKEQVKEYLDKKGIVKPYKDWLSSVEKGSKKIIEKEKYKIIPKRFYLGQGEYSEISPGELKVVKHPEKQLGHTFKREAIIGKRHEIDELRIGRKQLKKVGATGTSIAGKKVGGTHVSDEVLARERELTRISDELYNDKSYIAKIRDKSGEYKGIKGKTLKQMRIESLKDAKKINPNVRGLFKAEQNLVDVWISDMKTIKDPTKLKEVILDNKKYTDKNFTWIGKTYFDSKLRGIKTNNTSLADKIKAKLKNIFKKK